MFKKPTIKKGIALAVAGIFLIQDALWAQGLLTTRQVPAVKLQSEIPLNETHWLQRLNLSSEVGQIDRLHRAQTPYLIHIRDSHANLDAQEKIVSILKKIESESPKPLLIAVEGTKGPVLTTLTRSIPDKEIREKTAGYFLKEGTFTGAEAYSVLAEKAPLLYGVEALSLYEANRKAFNRVKKEAETVLPQLKQEWEQIQLEREKVFSKKLQNAVHDLEAFEEGKISFSQYAGSLSWSVRKTLQKEVPLFVKQAVRTDKLSEMVHSKSIREELKEYMQWAKTGLVQEDLVQLIEKQLQFKLGNITAKDFYSFVVLSLPAENEFPHLRQYRNLIELHSQIDPVEVMKWVHAAEKEILDHLANSPEEKALLEKSRVNRISRKLMRLQCSPEDLEYFHFHKSEFPAGQVASAVLFYRLAQKRDAALVQNTLKLAARKPEHQLVLLTGGFHTSGMTSILKKKGVSFAVISPKLAGETDEARYLKKMKIALSPLEKILLNGGNRLAAPTPFAVGWQKEELKAWAEAIARKQNAIIFSLQIQRKIRELAWRKRAQLSDEDQKAILNTLEREIDAHFREAQQELVQARLEWRDEIPEQHHLTMARLIRQVRLSELPTDLRSHGFSYSIEIDGRYHVVDVVTGDPKEVLLDDSVFKVKFDDIIISVSPAQTSGIVRQPKFVESFGKIDQTVHTAETFQNMLDREKGDKGTFFKEVYGVLDGYFKSLYPWRVDDINTLQVLGFQIKRGKGGTRYAYYDRENRVIVVDDKTLDRLPLLYMELFEETFHVVKDHLHRVWDMEMFFEEKTELALEEVLTDFEKLLFLNSGLVQDTDLKKFLQSKAKDVYGFNDLFHTGKNMAQRLEHPSVNPGSVTELIDRIVAYGVQPAAKKSDPPYSSDTQAVLTGLSKGEIYRYFYNWYERYYLEAQENQSKIPPHLRERNEKHSAKARKLMVALMHTHFDPDQPALFSDEDLPGVFRRARFTLEEAEPFIGLIPYKERMALYKANENDLGDLSAGLIDKLLSNLSINEKREFLLEFPPRLLTLVEDKEAKSLIEDVVMASSTPASILDFLKDSDQTVSLKRVYDLTRDGTDPNGIFQSVTVKSELGSVSFGNYLTFIEGTRVLFVQELTQAFLEDVLNESLIEKLQTGEIQLVFIGDVVEGSPVIKTTANAVYEEGDSLPQGVSTYRGLNFRELPEPGSKQVRYKSQEFLYLVLKLRQLFPNQVHHLYGDLEHRLVNELEYKNFSGSAVRPGIEEFKKKQRDPKWRTDLIYKYLKSLPNIGFVSSPKGGVVAGTGILGHHGSVGMGNEVLFEGKSPSLFPSTVIRIEQNKRRYKDLEAIRHRTRKQAEAFAVYKERVDQDDKEQALDRYIPQEIEIDGTPYLIHGERENALAVRVSEAGYTQIYELDLSVQVPAESAAEEDETLSSLADSMEGFAAGLGEEEEDDEELVFGGGFSLDALDAQIDAHSGDTPSEGTQEVISLIDIVGDALIEYMTVNDDTAEVESFDFSNAPLDRLLDIRARLISLPPESMNAPENKERLDILDRDLKAELKRREEYGAMIPSEVSDWVRVAAASDAQPVEQEDEEPSDYDIELPAGPFGMTEEDAAQVEYSFMGTQEEPAEEPAQEEAAAQPAEEEIEIDLGDLEEEEAGAEIEEPTFALDDGEEEQEPVSASTEAPLGESAEWSELAESMEGFAADLSTGEPIPAQEPPYEETPPAEVSPGEPAPAAEELTEEEVQDAVAFAKEMVSAEPEPVEAAPSLPILPQMYELHTNLEDIQVVSKKAARRKEGEANEDYHFALDLKNGIRIAGVFDGMGGVAGGAMASQLVGNYFQGIMSTLQPSMSDEEVVEDLQTAFDMAQNKLNEQLGGMHAGTTVTVAVIMPPDDKSYARVFIASVADSRAYLFERGEKLIPLTIDNYNPEEPIQFNLRGVTQELDKKEQPQKTLSGIENKEDLELLKKKNNLAAMMFEKRHEVYNVLKVGGETIPVFTVFQAPPKSHLLLTSDFIHDNLNDKRIEESLKRSLSAETLYQEARKVAQDPDHLRRKDDDGTAVLIHATPKAKFKISGSYSTEPEKKAGFFERYAPQWMKSAVAWLSSSKEKPKAEPLPVPAYKEEMTTRPRPAETSTGDETATAPLRQEKEEAKEPEIDLSEEALKVMAENLRSDHFPITIDYVKKAYQAYLALEAREEEEERIVQFETKQGTFSFPYEQIQQKFPLLTSLLAMIQKNQAAAGFEIGQNEDGPVILINWIKETAGEMKTRVIAAWSFAQNWNPDDEKKVHNLRNIISFLEELAHFYENVPKLKNQVSLIDAKIALSKKRLEEGPKKAEKRAEEPAPAPPVQSTLFDLAPEEVEVPAEAGAVEEEPAGVVEDPAQMSLPFEKAEASVEEEFPAEAELASAELEGAAAEFAAAKAALDAEPDPEPAKVEIDLDKKEIKLEDVMEAFRKIMALVNHSWEERWRLAHSQIGELIKRDQGYFALRAYETVLNELPDAPKEEDDPFKDLRETIEEAYRVYAQVYLFPELNTKWKTLSEKVENAVAQAAETSSVEEENDIIAGAFKEVSDFLNRFPAPPKKTPDMLFQLRAQVQDYQKELQMMRQNQFRRQHTSFESQLIKPIHEKIERIADIESLTELNELERATFKDIREFKRYRVPLHDETVERAKMMIRHKRNLLHLKILWARERKKMETKLSKQTAILARRVLFDMERMYGGFQDPSNPFWEEGNTWFLAEKEWFDGEYEKVFPKVVIVDPKEIIPRLKELLSELRQFEDSNLKPHLKSLEEKVLPLAANDPILSFYKEISDKVNTFFKFVSKDPRIHKMTTEETDEYSRLLKIEKAIAGISTRVDNAIAKALLGPVKDEITSPLTVMEEWLSKMKVADRSFFEKGVISYADWEAVAKEVWAKINKTWLPSYESNPTFNLEESLEKHEEEFSQNNPEYRETLPTELFFLWWNGIDREMSRYGGTNYLAGYPRKSFSLQTVLKNYVLLTLIKNNLPVFQSQSVANLGQLIEDGYRHYRDIFDELFQKSGELDTISKQLARPSDRERIDEIQARIQPVVQSYTDEIGDKDSIIFFDKIYDRLYRVTEYRRLISDLLDIGAELEPENVKEIRARFTRVKSEFLNKARQEGATVLAFGDRDAITQSYKKMHEANGDGHDNGDGETPSIESIRGTRSYPAAAGDYFDLVVSRAQDGIWVQTYKQLAEALQLEDPQEVSIRATRILKNLRQNSARQQVEILKSILEEESPYLITEDVSDEDSGLFSDGLFKGVKVEDAIEGAIGSDLLELEEEKRGVSLFDYQIFKLLNQLYNRRSTLPEIENHRTILDELIQRSKRAESYFRDHVVAVNPSYEFETKAAKIRKKWLAVMDAYDAGDLSWEDFEAEYKEKKADYENLFEKEKARSFGDLGFLNEAEKAAYFEAVEAEKEEFVRSLDEKVRGILETNARYEWVDNLVSDAILLVQARLSEESQVDKSDLQSNGILEALKKTGKKVHLVYLNEEDNREKGLNSLIHRALAGLKKATDEEKKDPFVLDERGLFQDVLKEAMTEKGLSEKSDARRELSLLIHESVQKGYDTHFEQRLLILFENLVAREESRLNEQMQEKSFLGQATDKVEIYLEERFGGSLEQYVEKTLKAQRRFLNYIKFKIMQKRSPLSANAIHSIEALEHKLDTKTLLEAEDFITIEEQFSPSEKRLAEDLARNGAAVQQGVMLQMGVTELLPHDDAESVQSKVSFLAAAAPVLGIPYQDLLGGLRGQKDKVVKLSNGLKLLKYFLKHKKVSADYTPMDVLIVMKILDQIIQDNNLKKVRPYLEPKAPLFKKLRDESGRVTQDTPLTALFRESTDMDTKEIRSFRMDPSLDVTSTEMSYKELVRHFFNVVARAYYYDITDMRKMLFSVEDLPEGVVKQNAQVHGRTEVTGQELLFRIRYHLFYTKPGIRRMLELNFDIAKLQFIVSEFYEDIWPAQLKKVKQISSDITQLEDIEEAELIAEQSLERMLIELSSKDGAAWKSFHDTGSNEALEKTQQYIETIDEFKSQILPGLAWEKWVPEALQEKLFTRLLAHVRALLEESIEEGAWFDEIDAILGNSLDSFSSEEANRPRQLMDKLDQLQQLWESDRKTAYNFLVDMDIEAYEQSAGIQVLYSLKREIEVRRAERNFEAMLGTGDYLVLLDPELIHSIRNGSVGPHVLESIKAAAAALGNVRIEELETIENIPVEYIATDENIIIWTTPAGVAKAPSAIKNFAKFAIYGRGVPLKRLESFIRREWQKPKTRRFPATPTSQGLFIGEGAPDPFPVPLSDPLDTAI